MKCRRNRSIIFISFLICLLVSNGIIYFNLDKKKKSSSETTLVVASNNTASPSVKNVKDKAKPNESKPANAAAVKKTISYKDYAISENIVKINPYSDEVAGKKTAFLTFDDGPTPHITPAVLDILKKEKIKATFFVVGNMAEKNPEILKRVKKEGHAIAKHSHSHNYHYIYDDPINFLEDYKKADAIISSIIGDYNRSLIRFPGGSFGRTIFKEAAEAAGYHYVDWNSLNGDAEGKKYSPKQLVQNVKKSASGKKRVVILMHDASGKENTVKALPEIIHYLRSRGYEFRTLN